MKKKLKYILDKVNIDYIIILIIAIVLSVPMFSSKLDVYADDGIQHIARAFGTYETIKEGVMPKVISSFTNGYGYSWDLFYGSFTSFGIIIANIITNSWINAYKLFSFILLLLSGIFMYIFMYKFSENKKTGLLAGCLYMTFPYHLTDLYIRNAIRRVCFFCFYTISLFRII